MAFSSGEVSWHFILERALTWSLFLWKPLEKKVYFKGAPYSSKSELFPQYKPEYLSTWSRYFRYKQKKAILSLKLKP